MSEAIRASYTKAGLAQVKHTHRARWERVRLAIGDSLLSEIRAASTISWMPASSHAAVMDAIIEVLGRTEARAIWRDVILAAFEGRLLSTFVGGALRLYGHEPSSVMRMTPHAWPLIFRDCGRSWMEPASQCRAVMRFEGLPAVITASTGMLDSFAANCDAALAYVGCRGQVVTGPIDTRAGTYEIHVDWQQSLRPSAH